MSLYFEKVVKSIINNMKMFGNSSTQYKKQTIVLSSLKEVSTKLNGNSFEDASIRELISFVLWLEHIGFSTSDIFDSLRKCETRQSRLEWKQEKWGVIESWRSLIKFFEDKFKLSKNEIDQKTYDKVFKYFDEEIDVICKLYKKNR